ERAFAPDLREIRWAVVDSGIDATHPAFRRRTPDGTPEPQAFSTEAGTATNHSRIVETYDFTRLRRLLSPAPGDSAVETLSEAEQATLGELTAAVQSGRAIAWDLVRPLLRITDDHYAPPVHEHGTHVGGILAADWRKAEQDGLPDPEDVRGICPTLELYDLRVTDDQGGCEEFSVIAALQFARWLNGQTDRPVLHGAN